MKILYVANVSDLYGASRSLLRLTSRLVQDNHRVEVILPGDGPLRPRLEKAGVAVLIHSGLPVISRRALKTPLEWLRLLVRSVASTIQLVAHIRASRPDLVHTNSAVVISSGLAARLCGTPHVWHMREFFAGASPLWRCYQRFMAGCSTRVVCISGAVACQFGRSIRRRKVSVIHNGIPSGEMAPAGAETVAAFRARHGLTAGPLVGVVGRINLEQKGQDVFVRAAALLSRRFPEARFVIAGDPYPGNEAHAVRLRRLVAELDLSDRVSFTGGVDDLPALHSALDICVLPARRPEGLGNVLLEAMALGKPVIGSAIGGIPEIIEDGKNGFLVPAGDPAALASAAVWERKAGSASRRSSSSRPATRACSIFTAHCCAAGQPRTGFWVCAWTRLITPTPRGAFWLGLARESRVTSRWLRSTTSWRRTTRPSFSGS
jgi:glycosyltransferase involved in cell wall biosynthesis